MQSRPEQLFVRVASLGVVAASIVSAGLMHTPATLPSTALGSAFLLFFERLAVVFVALLLLLVAVYRGWHGELPQRLSERGAEWEPVALEAHAVQIQLETLTNRIALVEGTLRELRATMNPGDDED